MLNDKCDKVEMVLRGEKLPPLPDEPPALVAPLDRKRPETLPGATNVTNYLDPASYSPDFEYLVPAWYDPPGTVHDGEPVDEVRDLMKKEKFACVGSARVTWDSGGTQGPRRASRPESIGRSVIECIGDCKGLFYRPMVASAVHLGTTRPLPTMQIARQARGRAQFPMEIFAHQQIAAPAGDLCLSVDPSGRFWAVRSLPGGNRAPNGGGALVQSTPQQVKSDDPRNEMKSFLLAFATLVLSASLAFGDDPCNLHPLRPDGRKNCLEIGAAVLKTSMDDMFAKDSAKIEAARKRYFALWPNRPGIDQAERDFLRALRQKDAYYLALSSSTVMNMVFVKAGNALAVLGGDSSLKDLNKVPDNMDGGIRPYARPLFARWVAAMRRAEDKKAPSGNALVDGSQNLMQFVAKMLNDPSANPSLLIDTLQDESNWRTAYEDARNWAELMSSGLNLSRLITPDIYIRSQMEADVSWSLGQNKQDNLPDPVEATLDFYKLFVKMFGEKEVLAAANVTLQAPKNSVGGLATRSPVEIGEFVASPSPNPYYLFLTQVTKSSPRAYATALAFDPNTLLTMQPAAAFSMKDNWQKANSVYTQLVAKYGEANVLAAAGRLKDTPKDSEGRIAGDPQSQPLRVWFQALLKDPKAAIPDGQVAHFRASSYDPRWMGKVVQVRGTVSGVVLDTNGLPRYATIHFKESKNDRFTVFTPNSEILENYGQNFSGLVGKPIEILGQVRDWREGAGIRFLSARELKVLDAGALANFRESAPDWMKVPLPAENLVDSPRYLAWKKFPAGTKAGYQHDLLHEYKPGTNQYTRTTISRFTFTLESINDEQAIVRLESTVVREDRRQERPRHLFRRSTDIQSETSATGRAGERPTQDRHKR